MTKAQALSIIAWYYTLPPPPYDDDGWVLEAVSDALDVLLSKRGFDWGDLEKERHDSQVSETAL